LRVRVSVSVSGGCDKPGQKQKHRALENGWLLTHNGMVPLSMFAKFGNDKQEAQLLLGWLTILPKS